MTQSTSTDTIITTQHRTIAVPIKQKDDDNKSSPKTNKNYILCSIVKDNETNDVAPVATLSNWTNFCASCFSYKPNPPPASYFYRHFINDPRRDVSLVRVLIDSEKNEIVSSVRIFRRVISAGNGETMEACGIGEVCTHTAHRGRGLAKTLLHDAIDIMENLKDEEGVRGVGCSLLHAGKSLMPVYERGGGYASVTTKWSVVKLHLSALSITDDDEGKYTIRNAIFPEDTTSLQRIHAKYSEKRFGGCIVRSEQYWNEYVSKELGDSLFVLTTTGEEEKKIVAWISIRNRGGPARYQLREFGVDTDCLETSVAVSMLLKFALKKEVQQITEEKDVDDAALEVVVPTPILDEVRNGKKEEDSASLFDWEAGVESEDDIGWMYRKIENDESGEIGMKEWTKEKDAEHLIWPTDSF